MELRRVYKRIRFYGIVQGVGFRPFVKRVADRYHIEGTVINKGSYVEIMASGSDDDVRKFYDSMKAELPERAVVMRSEIEELAGEACGQYTGTEESADTENGSEAGGSCSLAAEVSDAENAGETGGSRSLAAESRDTEKGSETGIRDFGGRFSIGESVYEDGEKFIPPDIGICDKCAEELYDPGNRRYLHPFINCTQCGPRFTILRKLPYDRERTSMASFPMCDDCREEYLDRESRRFDAQPVCCNKCGPEVYIIYRRPSPGQTDGDCRKYSSQLSSISEVRRVIASGGIAAVKGIGGFHLCCDASNERAVALLRERKKRPVKPFAVMMRDMGAVKSECECDPVQEKFLNSYQRPIILLKKRKKGYPGYMDSVDSKEFSGDAASREGEMHSGDGDSPERKTLSGLIAPGNPKLGVMLPYTPVHLLLFSMDDGIGDFDSLIMTSGNISGTPICITDAEAVRELSGIADIILSNNREILTRADDSVMDFFEGKPYMVRRSRGYAPLPIPVPEEIHRDSSHVSENRKAPDSSPGSAERKAPDHVTGNRIFDPSVLAVGGELKNTFCISKGRNLYPSAYIGDMTDFRSVYALRDAIDRMEELLEAGPEIVVSDLHPGYNSSVLADETGKRVIKIQHHYAHILSVMAENGCSEQVIGAAFDGTGYGTDGTIWGGEILKCDAKGFERLSHIRPFKQSGGDASAMEGWRMALSMIHEYFSDDRAEDILRRLELCGEREGYAVKKALENNVNVVMSTSVGRLFDSVSAVLGICRNSTFEGEAAMALQFAAENYEEETRENSEERRMDGFSRSDSERYEDGSGKARSSGLSETGELFIRMTEGALRGEDRNKLAFEFHRELALMTVNDIERHCKREGINTAALSGGCFQNLLLLRLVKNGLEERGIKVLCHSLTAPNDSSISIGQCFHGCVIISA